MAKHGKKDSLNNKHLNDVLIDCTINKSLARRQSQFESTIERNYLTSQDKKGADLLDEELVYRFGGSFHGTPSNQEDSNAINVLEMSLDEGYDDDE